MFQLWGVQKEDQVTKLWHTAEGLGWSHKGSLVVVWSLRALMYLGYLILWVFYVVLDLSDSYNIFSPFSAGFSELCLIFSCWSSSVFISYWMTSLWWQLGYASISQELVSLGYVFAITKSLNWSPACRFLGNSLVPIFTWPPNALLFPVVSFITLPYPTYPLNMNAYISFPTHSQSACDSSPIFPFLGRSRNPSWTFLVT